jgi:hypothetical protein
MLAKALVGSTGLATAQLVGSIPSDGMPISEVVKIIIQLIIGAGTLFQMFRKPKQAVQQNEPNNPENK